MKKMLLVLLTALALVACGGEREEKVDEEKKSEENVENVRTEAERSKGSPNESPVKVEDLVYEISIEEADTSGTVYADIEYTNKSDYIITYYNLTCLLKDINESTSYISSDSVLPNSMSPSFSSFGPKSGSTEDIEPIKLDYMIRKDEEAYRISYDYKTEKYHIEKSGIDRAKDKEIKVKADQVPYEVSLGEKDSLGNVYATLTYMNNSQEIIGNYSLEVLLKDSNQKAYYSYPNSVLAGEKSPNFKSYGPKSGLVEDMEARKLTYEVLNEDESRDMISYDFITKDYKVTNVKE